MPSLSLELNPPGTAVVLTSDDKHAAALGRLVSRFRSGAHRSPVVVEVPLDDFLTHFPALRTWPPESANDVHWHPELTALVRDSLKDAKQASDRLAEPDAPPVGTSPDDVREMLGPEWKADLTGFQRRDIAMLLAMRHGANFSVPGAGKTRVALADFQAKRRSGQVGRMLVVAPKSAHDSWREEADLCFERPLSVHTADGRSLNPLADVVLINYERLPAGQTALGKWLGGGPSMLVLDEAHRMKRGTAGVYGAVCLALAPRARRRLILTGTPAPNGAKDLQSLFNFVWPGQGGRTVEQATANRTLHQASSILKPFFCRTTKSELGLPPVNASVVRVPLSGLHRDIYSAIRGKEGLRAAGRAGDELERYGRVAMYLIMAATTPGLLSTGKTKYDPLPYDLPPLPIPQDRPLALLMQDLPRYEDSPKFREACRIVKANAERGRKTIVWSTFVRSLTTLERMLGGFAPAVVHGGTPKRDEELLRFRSDPDCMVLLSNPATLGEGISLHHVCHEAVYVDRDFNAGRFLQSLDRIHRLGLPPETETNVRILVAENTIDENVETRLADKLRFMGAVLDDPGVEQLGDLQDDPAAPAGLERADLDTLKRHLGRPPAA
ncbi:SNF2 domain-containing protein [Murinocardiopsis flavida]|uniref:SNF2 domain-containing protein n=1 Tax=Murinocardiopsis flavida TaxID=645275 RepID=A0A2P8CWL5_9ACTN|nr:DEAD/DEAH box helicase [Murinocardiopsis flavida]PSK89372.1 SNF2 domain-containing protein [Murinocardiopsis flavida]